MPDLVDAFFKRDLTESEQEALSLELLNSDKAALKFESRAKALYLSFGLAVPAMRWPKQGKLPWHAAAHHHGTGLLAHLLHAGHLSHWIWPSIFVVAAAGSVATWKHREAKIPAVEPAKLSAAPASVPAPAQAIARILPVRRAAQVTPVALNPGTTPVFSSLSVQVSQPHEGPVTVRVLDPAGAEVLTLYQGDLKPGDWNFEWNGKLADETPASPGIYSIEVASGTFLQKKTIQIQ